MDFYLNEMSSFWRGAILYSVGIMLYLILLGIPYFYLVKYLIKREKISGSVFITLSIASWIVNIFPFLVLVNDLYLTATDIVFFVLLMLVLTTTPYLIFLRKNVGLSKIFFIALLLGGIFAYIPLLLNLESPREVFVHAKRANMIDGSFYREGRFVRKNLDKADEVDREILERWLPYAEAGDTHGMYIVGSQYRLLKDQRCILWLEKAANKGNEDAKRELHEIKKGINNPWW